MRAKKAPAARLVVPADDQRLHEVRDFVTRASAGLGFAGRALANIRLAVDEACTNVVKHAYAGSSGTLQVSVQSRRGMLEIRVLDQGRPFDGKVEIPHLGQIIDTRRKGGLGVFLMHRLMDDVRYQTSPAGNEWILRKRLPRPTSEIAARLRRRWLLRATWVITACSIAAGVPFAYHEGRERARAEEAALLAHVRGLAEAARPVLLARAELTPAQTHLFEAVHALMRAEPQLVAITIVDHEQTIWASDRAAATFGRFVEPQLGAPRAGGIRRADERIDGVPVRHWSVAVRQASSDADLGAVHVSCRWAATRRAAQLAAARVLGAILVLDLIAIGLTIAFLARCLMPLQRLVDGVRALGQTPAETSEDDPDEIGAIAATLESFQSRFTAASESAAEHARLQEEMTLAREIQASILPQRLPEVPGCAIARLYRPAQEVGGDYYDFLDAGPNLTGIVVADVAGKGVPGSLVMSMVRTALRMETRRNAHAADVLARLHAFVSPDLRHGMFVTMLYVVLDTRTRVVSYASAGHTPMLLYHAARRATTALAPRGLPVGLAGSDAGAFASSLDVERVRLQPGDVLLLYTDGITEARAASGEEYGEARLRSVLERAGGAGADAVIAAIEEDLGAFLDGAPPQDDLTLVAIEEQERTPAVAGEVQARLFDLVDVQGVPLVEACKRVQVSPSTYHRLKRAAAATDPQPAPLAAAAPPLAPAAAMPPAAEDLSSDALRGTIEHIDGEPEHALVRLEGVLESSACTVFEQLLASAASTQSRIAIDLGRVAYVSSRAWGVLAAQRQMLAPGGEIAVVGMRPEMEAVFRMLGFEAILRHGPDARTAFDRAVAPSSAAPDLMPAAPAERTEAAAAAEPALLAHAANAGDAERVTILTLSGVLDTTSAMALERRIDSLVEARTVHVLADVAGLEFVSSAGWGALAAALPKLRAAGGELRLFGLSKRLRDVFDLLSLDRVLPAHDVLAEALGAFAIATPPADAAAPAPAGDSTPPALDMILFAAEERGRDAALRELGWDEYVARLSATHATEEAA